MHTDNLFQQFLELNLKNNLLYFVIGVIIVVLITRQFLSRYIATFAFYVLKKIGRKPNKEAYYNLLVSPLQSFLVILIIFVSLEKLELPTIVSSYSLYGKITIAKLISSLSTIIIIILFINLLVKIIDYVATILEEKANRTVGQDDNQLIVFFKDFFKVLLVIVGFLLILKFGFGQNIGNLLTGLSIVGAAIALATKESLENLIASFIIFFDKPFVTGDFVKVQNVLGQVEKIGLRSTRIRTDDKTYVTVPNKQMVDSIVDNHSLRTLRKATIKLELDTENSIEKIKQAKTVIGTFLKEKEEISNFNLHFLDIIKGTYILQIDYFMHISTEDNFLDTKEEVNLFVLKVLDELQLKLFKPQAI